MATRAVPVLAGRPSIRSHTPEQSRLLVELAPFAAGITVAHTEHVSGSAASSILCRRAGTFGVVVVLLAAGSSPSFGLPATGSTSIRFEQVGLTLPGSPDLATVYPEIAKTLGGHAEQYQKFGRALNRDGKIDRVLYPFGGADPWSVFRLFENSAGKMPKEVLILDSEPFGTPRQIQRRFGDAQQRRHHFERIAGHADAATDGKLLDFQHVAVPTADQGLGPNMLWELERLGAQNIRVTFVDPETGRAAKSVAFRSRALSAKKPQAVEIRFDLAGEERKVVYLQHQLSPTQTSERAFPGILRNFIRGGYDAFVEKASGPILTARPESLPPLLEMLAGLNKKHGIMVSDDGWAWRALAKHGLVPLRSSRGIPGRFGYGNEDRLAVFKPAPLSSAADIERSLDRAQRVVAATRRKGASFTSSKDYKFLAAMAPGYLRWALSKLSPQRREHYRDLLLPEFQAWLKQRGPRGEIAATAFYHRRGWKDFELWIPMEGLAATDVRGAAGAIEAFQYAAKGNDKSFQTSPLSYVRKGIQGGQLSLESMLQIGEHLARHPDPNAQVHYTDAGGYAWNLATAIVKTIEPFRLSSAKTIDEIVALPGVEKALAKQSNLDAFHRSALWAIRSPQERGRLPLRSIANADPWELAQLGTESLKEIGKELLRRGYGLNSDSKAGRRSSVRWQSRRQVGAFRHHD